MSIAPFLRSLRRQVLPLLVVVAGFGWGYPTASGQDSPVSFAGSLETVVPAELRSLLIEKPYVLFLVDVGDDGTVFDAMAIESNHRDLIPAASQTLQAATLIPARENGVPVRRRASIYVTFYDPEQRAWHMGLTARPFGASATDAAQRRLFETSARSFAYGESAMDQLDEPIKGFHATRTVRTSAIASNATGRCLVAFIIGPDGRARFPEAIERDNDDVALSAALLLMRSRYTPPRRNGHPTFVKVQQEFVFKN